MLKRVLILAALALVLPAPAFAGTFSKEGATLVYTGTNAGETISGYLSGSTLRFTTYPAGTTFTATSGCVNDIPAYIDCPSVLYTRYEARGLGGADHFSAIGNIPATLYGGEGDDILDGYDQADTLVGGGGDDWLRGNGGPDSLSGGAGADRLEGGTGGDTIGGGDGVDVANYNYGVAPGVTVSIDGVANDGNAGEGDNVLPDVEDLWGSPFNDTLTGSSGPNTIRGAAGNDTITGLGGRDTLSGQAGADAILARDGVPDEIDCGSPVGGSAQVDLIDDVVNCAPVDASDEAQPDHDGDGVDRPADCDDRDPARRPGLFDVPENGIDEDCSGADAPQLDRDRDGFPVPRDCDDASAAINPAAREITGNGTDENCDGRAQPYPAIGVVVGDAWDHRRGKARIARLQLDRVKRGTRVTVRCKGKGCKPAKLKLKVRKRGGTLQLAHKLRAIRLRKGTRLELHITRLGTIGAAIRFTGRKRGIPGRRDLCLPPGGKPGRC